MTLANKIAQLKNHKTQALKAQGAADAAKAELEALGYDNVAAAEQDLDKLHTEAAAQEQDFERRYNEFQDTWGDKLRRLEGADG